MRVFHPGPAPNAYFSSFNVTRRDGRAGPGQKERRNKNTKQGKGAGLPTATEVAFPGDIHMCALVDSRSGPTWTH